MALVRNITGAQTFTDQPLQADVHKVRQIYVSELRDRVQDIVDDLDTHIGNKGVDHHAVADHTTAGFMSGADKATFDAHMQEHTGPIGGAHGVASAARHGFHSKEDKYAWDNHKGYGGYTEHPDATHSLSGFLSAQDKARLDTIWSNYVTRTEWLANMFKVYLVTRESPYFYLGSDGGTGYFYFDIDRGPLEAAAGRELMPYDPIFHSNYTVNSYLYDWSSPFPVYGAATSNQGSSVRVGLILGSPGTYHRSGALQFNITVPLVPANTVVPL